jgi:hypothetical protein
MVVKLQNYGRNLYGRHSTVFISKHTTLTRSNKPQVYLDAVSYLDMNWVINRTDLSLSMYTYCCLCILIVRPCILNVV